MPSIVRSARGALLALALVAAGSGVVPFSRAHAQDDPAAVLELRFTPAPRAQIAIWIEDENGRFIRTFGLTQAIAFRGIGNRPGASLMNSGYRWPYGRREGSLPIWASRRAAEPGARKWKRVVFQSRIEGLASRTAEDQSPDDYFCLSFNRATTTHDALDAVSCASVFTSDKGRFITAADVEAGYGEPWQEPGASTGSTVPLSIDSLYPPRMDMQPCGSGCYDSKDLASFAAHARAVMPEIDEVTMATPPGMVEQSLLFSVPPEWPAGTYSLWIEVGIEGDYNDAYSAQTFPTPTLPENGWDSWAQTYGYAYRGQPSVAYKVSFEHREPGEASYSTSDPEGRASWDIWSSSYGKLESLSGMSDAPAGSGMDRLVRGDGGQRVHLHVQTLSTPPGPTEGEPDPFGGEPAEPEPDPEPTLEPGTVGSGGSGGDAGIGPSAGSDGGGEAGSAEPDEEGSEPDPRDEATTPDDRVPPADEDDDAVILFEPGNDGTGAIGPIRELRVARHGDRLHAHEWIKLSFLAARSKFDLHSYEVRVATQPISDVASFIRNGRPAKTATLDAEGAVSLMIDPKVKAGESIRTEIGDLVAETHYYVAVRATDRLNRRGPISVAQITTPKREFATVTPCFVASAAYGSDLADEVGVLRRVRDRALLTHAPGRALVRAYYAHGAELASLVREQAWLGSLARAVLRPIVAVARELEAERDTVR
jgi:hypothetical protein